MLLKIDFRPEDVIYQNVESGRIIVQLRYYGEFASAIHLATTKGETKDDFDKNVAKSSKTVFVGQNGGLSIG